ncbi:MAG: DEAD/DEAH box helicase, partial [Geminicoccaceae bacterium]
MLLPYPFPGPFDYRVPAGLEPKPGDVVLVPLNRREEVGVVWDAPADTAVPAHKLKSVVSILDTPPMTESLRRFVDWIAAYTLTPPGEVMAMALRVVSGVTKLVVRYRRADVPPTVRLTPPRQRVLDVLAQREPLLAGELLLEADASPAVLRGMVDAGLVVTELLTPGSPFLIPDPDHPGSALSSLQLPAAVALQKAVDARAFSVTLLDGVTGSGKTEVYLEAVATCLRQGRQALVMLPEIALSSQWTERFERRFGVTPAVWHSDLPSRTRKITWQAVAA